MRTPFMAICCGVIAAALSAQQEETRPDAPASGPTAGMKLKPIKVYSPAGARAGKEFDLAAEIGNAPGAILFVHEFTGPAYQVIIGLDQLALEYGLFNFEPRLVMLAADRTQVENRARRLEQAYLSPLFVSVDGAEGPGDYALNRKVTLTLVTCKDGAVVDSIGLNEAGKTTTELVRKLVEKVIGPPPKDYDALRKELLAKAPADAQVLKDTLARVALQGRRQQRQIEGLQEQLENMRKREAGEDPLVARQRERERQEKRTMPGRQGKAPEDEELKGLLRSIVQKDIDKDRVAGLVTKVDERVGNDIGLRAQAVDMFRMVVTLGYGGEEARARAAEYVDKHSAATDKYVTAKREAEEKAAAAATEAAMDSSGEMKKSDVLKKSDMKKEDGKSENSKSEKGAETPETNKKMREGARQQEK